MNERSGRTTRTLKALIQAVIDSNGDHGLFVVRHFNQVRYITNSLLLVIMGSREYSLQNNMDDWRVIFDDRYIRFILPSQLDDAARGWQNLPVAIDHYVYETATEQEWIVLRRIARYEKVISAE